MRFERLIPYVLIFAATLSILQAGFSQTSQTAGTELSVESLTTRREQIAQSTDIEQSLKEKILQAYDSAIADAKLIAQIHQECDGLEQNRKNAPQALEDTRKKIEQTKNASEEFDTSDAVEMPLEDVQKHIGSLKLQLRQATAELEKLNAESQKREEIIQLEPSQSKELQNLLDETKKQFEQIDQQKYPVQLAEATRFSLQTRQAKFQEQVTRLKYQLASFEAESDLLKAQKELATLTIGELKKQIDAWQAVVARKESSAARLIARQIRRDIDQMGPIAKIPQIDQMAQKTLEMSKDLEGEQNIFLQNKQIEDKLDKLKKELDRINSTYELTRKKVENIGLTEPVGIRLRRQLALLRSDQSYRRESQEQIEKLDKLQLLLMEYQEELDEFQDMDDCVTGYINNIKPEISPEEKPEAEAGIKKLFLARKEILQKLTPAYEQYVKNIENVQLTTEEIINKTDEFRNYINARLLWIKSNSPMTADDLKSVGVSLKWLTSPKAWKNAGEKLVKRISQRPDIAALLLIFFGGLLIAKRKLTKILYKVNLHVQSDVFSPFSQTAIAIALTAVLSTIMPAVIWLIGQQLLQATDKLGFTSALGDALKFVAIAWWPAGFLRMICNPRGIGPTHFRWPAEPCREVWRAMRLFMPVGLLIIFLATLTNAPVVPVEDDALSRTMTMLGLALLCAANVVLLRPGGVIVRETIGRKKRSWLHKLRYPIFFAVLIIPILLIIAVYIGYFETAIEFTSRLLSQLWLVLLVIVLNSSILRWLLLGRRKIIVARRQQRIEEEAKEKVESDPSESDAKLDIQTEELDISEVHAQTKQIVRYLMAIIIVLGMQMIWSGTFPALRFLSKFTLWTTGTGPDAMTISLGHLVGSLLILFIMVVVNNNIPGMMEMILNRFKLDAGIRYAISTVTRYSVIMIGLIVSLQTIGITWKSIQWLVAAVSLGVGFGLQEIVANFVSGLIILFERPIRMGDIITIGDITGVVSKIRIRATTITDWSRKELIVPNKDFITGQLVNWTLSDSVLRLNIPVGIAYGSDTALAKQILVKIAKECTYVIDDPAPYAIFKEFGDSTLNFELRAYISGMDNFIAAWDHLVTSIDNEFRKNNIEIAFPQMDLHVRSVEAPVPIKREDLK